MAVGKIRKGLHPGVNRQRFTKKRKKKESERKLFSPFL